LLRRPNIDFLQGDHSQERKRMPQADVNGTTLHYRFEGPDRGPVIMFSNSLASDLAMWDAQMPALVKAGYRVLRYDSRGHGQSAAPAGPYTIEMLAADAVGLMDAIGLEKVHFCGLSMGGMVGQMLGARHGNRLMSLTLCSTAAVMPLREIWDERIATVRRHGLEAVLDATIDRWFTGAGQERLPAEVEKIRRMILSTPLEGYCACCEAIREMNLCEALSVISIPALVMVGEHDIGTPISAAAFIHERIASSELRIIPDAAHFANVEQAALFNEILLEFIEKA
jgi:3-oxoadipate enol-lactonase